MRAAVHREKKERRTIVGGTETFPEISIWNLEVKSIDGWGSKWIRDWRGRAIGLWRRRLMAALVECSWTGESEVITGIQWCDKYKVQWSPQGRFSRFWRIQVSDYTSGYNSASSFWIAWGFLVRRLWIMMTPSTWNLNRATRMDYQWHKVNRVSSSRRQLCCFVRCFDRIWRRFEFVLGCIWQLKNDRISEWSGFNSSTSNKHKSINIVLALSTDDCST